MTPRERDELAAATALSVAEAKARIRAWGTEAEASQRQAFAQWEQRVRGWAPRAAAVAGGFGVLAGVGGVLGGLFRGRSQRSSRRSGRSGSNAPAPDQDSGPAPSRVGGLLALGLAAVRLAPTAYRFAAPVVSAFWRRYQRGR